MKFTVEYPIERGPYAPEFLDPDALAEFARTAEAAGFDAIAFSEHPAPSRKWIEAGGHDTFDPLAALAFCAAATSRIRLMTHLLVLPYHNPLQVAKTLATVDILSRGRLVVVAGTGYLRSEFAAVGVDFDQRNTLFDEAVAAITTAWSGDAYAYQGRHFRAVDQVLRPRPLQQPHPPLWIGGNSPLTRRRVVRYGRGWSPMLTAGRHAPSLRTPPIDSIEELAAAVTDLHAQLRDAGRQPDEVEIQLEAPTPAEAGGPADPAAHRETLQDYAKAGVTSALVHVPADSLENALAAVRDYGAAAISA
ncbi:TIGR03619 family F420-dependent LLM class oxidoreductase [Cryptosporangium aurantiacum]|uniref:Probable F420-dependent oxidoreductase, Rv2161c family n=1 Tax=Cryptosporangium aurantiacum TaxID=134849 RepID=A0A1M7PMV4_9ACTN|nr:TIGR03619 family F420-dependent LLM class oxidoreductase [Cryptosporangium aurantiacum]SHN18419.1 probable F420-dependent oxidoreductase, Rv2161c family [Cryptosporangium aurantiacum]